MLDNIIGVEEAAEILGLSPGYIKNLCARGRIKAKKVGKTWIIDKTDLILFKNEKKKTRRKIKMNKTYQEELKEKFSQLLTAEELQHMDEIVLDDKQIQDPPFVYHPISDRWDILANMIQTICSCLLDNPHYDRILKREMEYWGIPEKLMDAAVKEIINGKNLLKSL